MIKFLFQESKVISCFIFLLYLREIVFFDLCVLVHPKLAQQLQRIPAYPPILADGGGVGKRLWEKSPQTAARNGRRHRLYYRGQG